VEIIDKVQLGRDEDCEGLSFYNQNWSVRSSDRGRVSFRGELKRDCPYSSHPGGSIRRVGGM